MRTIDGSIESVLQQHLERRYVPSRGKIVKVETAKNKLGEPIFREVHFKDGTYVTFCLRASGKGWFRHTGGGRYGERAKYEGRLHLQGNACG